MHTKYKTFLPVSVFLEDHSTHKTAIQSTQHRDPQSYNYEGSSLTLPLEFWVHYTLSIKKQIHKDTHHFSGTPF